jgi:hypothetical protein
LSKTNLARFAALSIPLLAVCVMVTPGLRAQTNNLDTPSPPQDKSEALPDAPLAASNAVGPSTTPLALNGRAKAAFYSRRILSFTTVTGPAIEAAAVMSSPPKAYPGPWRQGAEAYGRNFGASLGRIQTAEFSRFVVGVAIHEDPRYFPAANPSFAMRAAHAIGFTLVDHSDSGRSRPAFANLIGAAAGGFVGNAYLPEGYTDLRHAGVRTGVQMANFAVGNLVEEFTPELEKLSQALASRLHRRK